MWYNYIRKGGITIYHLTYSDDVIFVLDYLAEVSQNPDAYQLFQDIIKAFELIERKGIKAGTALERDLEGSYKYYVGLGYTSNGGWRIIYEPLSDNEIFVYIVSARPQAYELAKYAKGLK